MKMNVMEPQEQVKTMPFRETRERSGEIFSAMLTAEVDRVQREEQAIIDQRRADELAKQRELARFD